MFFAARSDKSERGQMVVIVALALTTLIAMAGLVIDGGMALSNRRQVQNAADSAALAGTRVLGLDLKWRAVNAGNPSPPPAPFANVDDAVCDAINNALAYNTNSAQTISPIDCYAGSDDAWYVEFGQFDADPEDDMRDVGRVGEGVPGLAQGVRVQGSGQSATFLMGVIGIDSIGVGGEATALAGPGEPPLGNLMPFVAQNPLGPFIPGDQYQIRSEDEGECGAAAPGPSLADVSADIMFASYVQPADRDGALAAPPSVPIADPPSSTFTTSITVTITAESGAKIRYTTDGTAPTGTSTQYTGPLTFTSTTTLKAVADKGSQLSEVGTYNYTQGTPPEPVTATPGDGTTFTGSQLVTLSTTTSPAVIRYTTDGTDPTLASAVYGGAINLTASTQIRAMATAGGINSVVSTFNYTLDGETEPPVASPVSGTEFETTLNVTLTAPTPGSTIYYTLDGTTPTTSSLQYAGPFSLVSTTTIRAFAQAGGNDSLVVDFTYTKTGPVCPELTAGNFGWIDYSGGSNSNADLKDEIQDPSSADSSWYYDTCAGVDDTNCRDPHDAGDPADDHWLVEGTPGHRDNALGLVCGLYLGQIIYVPIWDNFNMLATAKPNGNNAVFHIIGFAAFRLDGIIDNHQTSGVPTNDACGDGLGAGGTANDKGFIGTYVDSFVGTQVAPCIPSPDGTNPCQNLQNDRLEINLAR
jgi:hypothetical protein